MVSSSQRTIIFFFFVLLSCVSGYFSFIHNPDTITAQIAPSQAQYTASQPTASFIGNKKAGFNSLTQECPKISIACKGTLPTWLQGDLLGTGPAQFELGSTKVKYWFNGLAMLHAFHIQNGNLEYHNKFLESEYYKRSIKNGKFDRSMSTEKPKGFFSRLAGAMNSSDPYDNGTIAVTKLHNTFFALTETPLPVAFDPKTLATTELIQFNDGLEGHLTTAQFQYDPTTNEFFNYMTEFASSSNYHLYKIKNGDTKRTLITTIPVKSPSYMRSFGMTKNYLVLVEIPFVVNPFDLVMATGAFVESVSWKPQLGTNLIVVNKHTGELVGTHKTDALFMFNTINAFEDANKIRLDLVAHDDASLINCTILEVLLDDNNKKEFSSSYAERIEIDLEKNIVTKKQLSQKIIEFPTFNKNYSMKDYTFVYGLGTDDKDRFPHQITKINIKTGNHNSWSEQGCYASVPVFIARPQSKQEDEGVILSVVFDSTHNNSFLIILDAQKLSELARFELPHHIPLGLISQFYSA